METMGLPRVFIDITQNPATAPFDCPVMDKKPRPSIPRIGCLVRVSSSGLPKRRCFFFGNETESPYRRRTYLIRSLLTLRFSLRTNLPISSAPHSGYLWISLTMACSTARRYRDGNLALYRNVDNLILKKQQTCRCEQPSFF